MIKEIMQNYINFKYKFPKNCRIDYRSTFSNIVCEGYNTISKYANVSNVELGLLSNINLGCNIHNTKIGRYCSMGPRVNIIIGRHPTNKIVSINPIFYSMKKQNGFTFATSQIFNEFKYADEINKISVIVGNDVWIGSDANILEGVVIGDGAVIAAGSVVTKNVPPYAIVGGVPAKILKYRFEENEIKELLRIKWWDWEMNKLKETSNLFCDINLFLEKYGEKNDIQTM